MQAEDIGEVISIGISGKRFQFCIMPASFNGSLLCTVTSSGAGVKGVMKGYYFDNYIRMDVKNEKIVDGNRQLEYILT